MSDRLFKRKDITNILVIAWSSNGTILKASAFHDENAALAKSREYIEDEDTAHAVRYYARFDPGTVPETTLIPYGWHELEQ